MTASFFARLWKRGPLSWAVIRNEECKLLSQQKLQPPILEIGCGDGFVAQLAFVGKTKIDLGIDMDQKELSRARQTRMYKRLELVDVLDNSYPSSSFKTIYANSVLEHIKDLDKVLSEIHRLLKKRGKFINASPIATYTQLLFYYRLLNFLGFPSLAELYGKLINNVFFHRHLLTSQEWRRKLIHAGFEIEVFTHYLPAHIITLHDLFLPLAVYTRILKQYTGKMVFLETFRNVVFPYITPWVEKHLDQDPKSEARANVFFVARKK